MQSYGFAALPSDHALREQFGIDGINRMGTKVIPEVRDPRSFNKTRRDRSATSHILF